MTIQHINAPSIYVYHAVASCILKNLVATDLKLRMLHVVYQYTYLIAITTVTFACKSAQIAQSEVTSILFLISSMQSLPIQHVCMHGAVLCQV